MLDGAFGLSTGLSYPSGVFSSTEEVVELARVARAYGGLYVTHVRDYGDGLAERPTASPIGRRPTVSPRPARTTLLATEQCKSKPGAQHDIHTP